MGASRAWELRLLRDFGHTCKREKGSGQLLYFTGNHQSGAWVIVVLRLYILWKVVIRDGWSSH